MRIFFGNLHLFVEFRSIITACFTRVVRSVMSHFVLSPFEVLGPFEFFGLLIHSGTNLYLPTYTKNIKKKNIFVLKIKNIQ